VNVEQELRRAAERDAAGDLGAAAAIYRAVLAATGAHPGILAALGSATQRMGDAEGAEGHYRRALEFDPAQPAVLVNLGALVKARGDIDAALALFERAVESGGGAPAVTNLALALHETGDLDAALARYETAVALDPDLAVVRFNFANALADAGRAQAAIAQYRAALALDPGFDDARWNLAHVLLRAGDYPAGFAAFEARWQVGEHKGTLAGFAAPFWQGEARPGATILVWGEQGFGDVLQFARYVPMLAARGLRVVQAVQPSLVALMRTLDGVAQVVALDAALPPHDWHCPVMSLPRLCGTTRDDVPADIPYLSADPGRVADFRRHLPAEGLRVGLVWSSGIRRHSPTLYRIGVEKSLPGSLLEPLALPGVRLVSLQVGSDAPPPAVPLVDLGAELKSFADTAALVAALDLVVTVDTAVAHLAGALGKPVWILLNTQACWRWALAPDTSPWYPSARLYRQVRAGDWRTPLAAMERDLRALAAQGGERPGWLSRILRGLKG
jgi:Flp pilus assembly protein TadD